MEKRPDIGCSYIFANSIMRSSKRSLMSGVSPMSKLYNRFSLIKYQIIDGVDAFEHVKRAKKSSQMNHRVIGSSKEIKLKSINLLDIMRFY